jgi:hypothetical protein
MYIRDCTHYPKHVKWNRGSASSWVVAFDTVWIAKYIQAIYVLVDFLSKKLDIIMANW